jgi:hypothetical protein
MCVVLFGMQQVIDILRTCASRGVVMHPMDFEPAALACYVPLDKTQAQQWLGVSEQV